MLPSFAPNAVKNDCVLFCENLSGPFFGAEPGHVLKNMQYIYIRLAFRPNGVLDLKFRATSSAVLLDYLYSNILFLMY